MAGKIQHEPRYFDKAVIFGHVEDKLELDRNSTMKIYPQDPMYGTLFCSNSITVLRILRFLYTLIQAKLFGIILKLALLT